MLHYDILLIALPLTSRLSCSFLSCSPDLTRSTSLCSLGWGTQGSSPSMSSTAGIEPGEDYQALCPTGACRTALHCTVILMHLSHRKHLTLHTGRQRLDTTPMTFLESMTYYQREERLHTVANPVTICMLCVVCCRTKWKGWSPLEHRLFPADLKRAVRAMLLCQNRVIGGYEGDSNMTEEGETGMLCMDCS